MVRLLKKRFHKTNAISVPFIATEDIPEKIKISIIEYDEHTFFEKESASIQECISHIVTPSMTWIQVQGVTDPGIVATIGNRFQIHPLVLEDIVNTGQRTKLDVYDKQVFIVTHLLTYKDKEGLIDEQVSIILGPNYLISFLETEHDIFKSIQERIKQGNGNRIRTQGSDYLAYTLIDVIVDQYFFVLEKIDIYLDKLEEEVTHSARPNTVAKIQRARREMIFLRKSIWPMREVVNNFQHLDSSLISPLTRLYIRDVYDHIIQAIDMIEGFRDVVAGMLDIYLSSINIRTNDIVKVLTIVSTIFVPLTFISSLYGMNFEFMPELHKPWAYPAVLGFMAAIAISMLFFFHRKKWF